MQFTNDRPMTTKEIALGLRHRLNGLTPRDGLMVPYNGLMPLLIELERLWGLEDAFRQAPTEAVKRGPGRPPKVAE